MGEYSIVEKANHIMTVRINRPDRLNALHPLANAELGQVFDDFAADDDLWVAIIVIFPIQMDSGLLASHSRVRFDS